MITVAHNLTAYNAQRQFNLVNASRSKSAEKLSSGYRINRAADDAAGLAIPEKCAGRSTVSHRPAETARMA